ncbi:TetR/AcrR family transcriptional regulator [Flavobacterium aciduliphilum]|uniref:TetR family transcriptional regulator n=1 Tax=Flavobacterium aciduliphilum TaxID=1101402 RepID=A0A328YKY8_9FLAO|nr:TetR/AcrR family transcriptional regulator [Flavobacterium aciduliphilum]RAR74200.1 TetR family transcriptional regulator [Flavobacterium aciduliphilum]
MKLTDRKTEIVNVAATLFKEKGYSAVTMRDIAQAMDIKAASLYNHIKSKQEILVLIVIEIAEEFTNVMNEVVCSKDSAIKKIERIIQLHIDITLRDSNALACLNNDWMHLTDSDLEYFIKMRNDYEENFKAIIQKGIQEGDIKDLNIDVIIFSILSTLRTLYIWYNKTNKLSSKALTENMVKVLLNGIV